MAQNKMINPSNSRFHISESVAQYESYSLLGAYEDYGNNPYTGAVYLYQNGSSSPIRSYTFDQAI